jgi:rhodanese-related sulfurtransferase
MFRAIPDSGTPPALEPETVLKHAAARRLELRLSYAGAVTPPEAWQLIQASGARLIDVRTEPEYKFVGHVPGSSNVIWHGQGAVERAAFVEALQQVAEQGDLLLLLCRSGVRSHNAALAAQEAGFARVYNVLEGFEGQIDAHRQRGRLNGWRFHALPWEQD